MTTNTRLEELLATVGKFDADLKKLEDLRREVNAIQNRVLNAVGDVTENMEPLDDEDENYEQIRDELVDALSDIAGTFGLEWNGCYGYDYESDWDIGQRAEFWEASTC